ncbi:MAG: cytochrome c biogenesis protein CcsA, partial [Nitrospinae bacterium]|nr:cytochrome c biogenesis protein CcsA [Nitrospinota bacterium]
MREEAAEETPKENYILLWLTGAVIFAAIAAIYLYVPTEKTEGAVQRIMYFHIPSAWLSFFAFFVVFLCSILFLLKREREWDIYAHASAEIGMIFCSLVLITGPLWA